MVSLVDNMPSLVNLCVYDFESSTVPDKIVDCSDRLAPFSSKLQQLSIDCLNNEYPPVRTINAVVYMFTDDGYLDTRTLDIFGNNKY
ncbi:hypothetical protein IWW43_005442 [Coemansia sp. RSA 1935]|nr:hypothetical protein IWW43_005442 [Coemansia sp. RSA 1935]